MSADATTWHCNACDEAIESWFDQCWHCGRDKEGVADETFPRFDVIAPRCRACEYSLEGLKSDQCPECGVPFDRFSAVESPGIGASIRSLVKDESQLLCPACQTAITLFDHYCPKCSACVGQLSPNLPVEGIPVRVQFYGRIWQRAWYGRGVPWWWRVLALGTLFMLLTAGPEGSEMFIASPFVVLSLFLVNRGMDTVRSLRWHCNHCGYDLRGNMDASHCPECGAAIGNKLKQRIYVMKHDAFPAGRPATTDWSSLGMPTDRVVLVEHDPAWHNVFENESQRILHGCGERLIDVRHVGSTSVPGLCAKPILDLMPGVPSETDLDAVIEPLESLGYISRGELGIPGRRYFFLNVNNQRVAQLHVFAVDHPEYERHLVFSEHLRAHPEDAKRYADLKRRLAVEFEHDRHAYSDAKTELIQAIEAKAFAARDAQVDNNADDE